MHSLNIGKKMTKHAALEAAKTTVRETKGWEDSSYWAAFILLDGLDQQAVNLELYIIFNTSDAGSLNHDYVQK